MCAGAGTRLKSSRKAKILWEAKLRESGERLKILKSFYIATRRGT